jgi:hypothetical protein
MQITYHAGQRFLQRVFEFTSCSRIEISNAMKLLKRDLLNVELRNKSRVILPSFPDFYGVFVENTLVTVIPKRNHATL